MINYRRKKKRYTKVVNRCLLEFGSFQSILKEKKSTFEELVRQILLFSINHSILHPYSFSKNVKSLLFLCLLTCNNKYRVRISNCVILFYQIILTCLLKNGYLLSVTFKLNFLKSKWDREISSEINS